MVYSDEEEYVICRGAIGWPTWIWTKDNFNQSKLEEIKQAIDLYLTDNEKDKFTCKKELYEALVNTNYDKLNLEDYFEMGTLYCKQTCKPKDCKGQMEVADMKDKGVLIKYWFDDVQEMNDFNPITLEQAKKDVEEMLKSNKLYV